MHDQNKNIQKEIKRNQHILYEDGQIYIHDITKHWYGSWFNINTCSIKGPTLLTMHYK